MSEQNNKAIWYNNKHLLAAIVVAAILIGAAVIVSAHIKTQDVVKDNASNIQSPQANATMSYLKGASIVEIGETANYTTRDLVVNSAEAKKSISQYEESYVAENGSKYLIVSMTLTNTTKEPYRPEAFELWLEDGTRYQGETDSIGYGEDSMLRNTLNPGAPVTGTNLFTVPENLSEAYFGSLNASTDKFTGVKINF